MPNHNDNPSSTEINQLIKESKDLIKAVEAQQRAQDAQKAQEAKTAPTQFFAPANTNQDGKMSAAFESRIGDYVDGMDSCTLNLWANSGRAL